MSRPTAASLLSTLFASKAFSSNIFPCQSTELLPASSASVAPAAPASALASRSSGTSAALLLAVAAACAASSAVFATDINATGNTAATSKAGRSLHFDHHDWEIGCDNTGRCSALGYSPEDAEQAAALLLVREAGAAAGLEGRIKLSQLTLAEGAALPEHAQLHLNGKRLGELRFSEGEALLSAEQVAQLQTALPKTARIEIVAGADSWLISDRGATAVLLKMDDVQGRVNTASALVKKGSASAQQVPPPVAAPKVIARKLGGELQPATPEQLQVLLPLLRASISEDDCPLLFDLDSSPEPPQQLSVDSDRQIVAAMCWFAAYNTGSAYWLVENNKAQLITASGSSLGADGVLQIVQRGRGMGDCGEEQRWQWDGQGFVKSYESTNVHCRLVDHGGAWPLVLWRTELLASP